MKHTVNVNHWVERMFGDLSSPNYVVSVQGNSFDIFGLHAQAVPRGLMLDANIQETKDMGTLAHYEVQLDEGVIAELCITRPPARVARQHCLVRGHVRQVSRQ